MTSAQGGARGSFSTFAPKQPRLQGRLTQVLCVLTAVLTLVVIVLVLATAQANRDRNNAVAQVKGLQTNASNLTDTNKSLQAENKRLSEENERLRPPAANAAPGVVPGPATAAAAAGTMLAGYAISLSPGNGISLDAKAAGSADITASPNADLSYRSQFSSPFDIAMLAPNTVPTYDLCRSQTTFVKATPGVDQGMAFCIFKRNTPAIAGVAVLSSKPNSNAVTISVSVWQA